MISDLVLGHFRLRMFWPGTYTTRSKHPTSKKYQAKTSGPKHTRTNCSTTECFSVVMSYRNYSSQLFPMTSYYFIVTLDHSIYFTLHSFILYTLYYESMLINCFTCVRIYKKYLSPFVLNTWHHSIILVRGIIVTHISCE